MLFGWFELWLLVFGVLWFDCGFFGFGFIWLVCSLLLGVFLGLDSGLGWLCFVCWFCEVVLICMCFGLVLIWVCSLL